jgi:cell division septal protein FtsQ
MKYCVECERNVNPRKRFSFAWFIIMCLTGIGGIVYVLYYALLKRKSCPICGSGRLKRKR